MEYTVQQLAGLSGISSRTLRYYDQIDLLKPAGISASGYRLYGSEQVDRLQQILFYKELGLGLKEIRQLLADPDFDSLKALQNHLGAMQRKRRRMDVLIENIERTIASMKGDIVMSDPEKFEGFKRKLIEQNETRYGAEIRRKYGDEQVDAANARWQGMSPAQYERAESLRTAVNENLKAAMATGDPGGEAGFKTCELHRQWLELYSPQYSREYHRALAEMYVADERFKAYYEEAGPGAAEFLRDAIRCYCDD